MMKTLEDHAMDIFKEYPGITMYDLAMRLFLRTKIVPMVQEAIDESTPEVSNVVKAVEKDTVQ
jgi:hypothetical protein